MMPADTFLLLAALLSGAQDKPAAPVVPFAQILECVKAANCKNMKPATMSKWVDAPTFNGLVFENAGWRYGLYITGRTKDDLSIEFAAAQEPRATHLLVLDKAGQLVGAQLRWEPSGGPVRLMTGEDVAAKRVATKAFDSAERSPNGVGLGQEFKPFWQDQADEAVAAIRRQLSK